MNNILTAPVYDVAEKTPLDEFFILSSHYNNRIFIKREDMQSVFSFKCRGAYNKLIHLSESKSKFAGVITASAGNHAQGLALSANKLQIPATIVMPDITPQIKVDAVKRFGGKWVKIITFGSNFDAAAVYAKKLQKEQKLEFVHPFDDIDVIAGQGTIGKEIIEDLRHIDAIFVPVGGGGLIAGIGAYVKSVKPNVKIIGVEHDSSASMTASLKKGKQVVLEHVSFFADGVAVRRVGDKTFTLAKQVVDEMITVNTDQLCATINNIFDEKRIIVEASGAVALAGIKKWIRQNNAHGLNLVGILSGANMNFDSLRHITERTSIGAKAECLLGVNIPEQPGEFKKLCECIKNRSITEFNYRYSGSVDLPAHIFIGIAICNGQEEINKIISKLKSNNYLVKDFSNNDMVKLHMRYMVGGHNYDKPELLYRFEFPERPGALLNFLNNIGDNNITLFHYRNHGSDYGRVLIGIEKKDNINNLHKLIDNIGYYYVDETQNEAYKMFCK